MRGVFRPERCGDIRPVCEGLIDLARKLASEKFAEHVDALIEGAGRDGPCLALAAAQLSTDGPAHAGSLDQIAYSLLVEAFHKASRSPEEHPSLDDVA